MGVDAAEASTRCFAAAKRRAGARPSTTSSDALGARASAVSSSASSTRRTSISLYLKRRLDDGEEALGPPTRQTMLATWPPMATSQACSSTDGMPSYHRTDYYADGAAKRPEGVDAGWLLPLTSDGRALRVRILVRLSWISAMSLLVCVRLRLVAARRRLALWGVAAASFYVGSDDRHVPRASTGPLPQSPSGPTTSLRRVRFVGPPLCSFGGDRGRPVRARPARVSMRVR